MDGCVTGITDDDPDDSNDEKLNVRMNRGTIHGERYRKNVKGLNRLIFQIGIKALVLFTHDLHDEVTDSGACIKINEDNLLPGAQRESPLDDWNSERWALQLAS